MTSIGGQAVIEGVMMRGPHKIATAVRKPDGEIIIDEKENKSLGKIAKVPIIRGVIAFISSMVIGVKSLMFSAKFYDVEDENKKEKKKSCHTNPAVQNLLALFLRGIRASFCRHIIPT